MTSFCYLPVLTSSSLMYVVVLGAGKLVDVVVLHTYNLTSIIITLNNVHATLLILLLSSTPLTNLKCQRYYVIHHYFVLFVHLRIQILLQRIAAIRQTCAFVRGNAFCLCWSEHLCTIGVCSPLIILQFCRIVI